MAVSWLATRGRRRESEGAYLRTGSRAGSGNGNVNGILVYERFNLSIIVIVIIQVGGG